MSDRPADPQPFEATGGAQNLLRGDAAGEGSAVVQLHGLTATRRHVVHGSRLLQRRGYASVRYDARGHGASDPAPEGHGYGYPELADDLAAVVRARSLDRRVVLAGHSMGAHTATAYALAEPDRVAALVAIGPASLGEEPGEGSVEHWERLASGLEQDGVEGFVRAYDDGSLDPEWRDVLLRITRERLAMHEHPEAVAQALREVPRSAPFEALAALERLDVPALVVASHDDSDPGHPYAIAERWAERLPQARLVSEEPGESPLAWSGGKLSREIDAFCSAGAVAGRLRE